VDRPTFADEFLLAVAVAIGDARRRFAQDDAECDARAGYALFTNNLHACNSGSGNTGNRFVFSRGKRKRLSRNGKTLRRYRHRALHGVMKVRKYRNVNSCFLDEVSWIWGLVWLCGRPPILSEVIHARQRNHISHCYTETRLTSRTKPAFRVQQRRAATQNSSCEHPNRVDDACSMIEQRVRALSADQEPRS
jgi:hypothetical protein